MKTRVIFVAVLLPLVHRICSEGHGIRGRIFNGHDALDGQFNYMVGVIACATSPCSSEEGNVCGGTLIGPNWVLTAAHCLHKKEMAEIFLGATNRHEAEISYIVQKPYFKLHPNFRKEHLQNDIALIQTPKVRVCEKIGMVCMPKQWADRTFTGEKAISLGWGMNGDDGDFPDRLQWAEVKVISNERCKNVFPNDIRDSNICVSTKPPYGSICTGDSGGPLVLRDTNELIGVVSGASSDGCEKGKPAIFARVTSYMLWITKETGISF